MPGSNTTRSYGSISKTFHWLTALLIFTVAPVGIIANGLAGQIQSPDFSGSQEVIERATLLFSIHKTLGVTIFFTALARILWALSQPKPGLLNAEYRLEALAAETVHWLLYGSMLLVPLSGWIHHTATTGFAPIWWPFGQSLPFVPKSDSVAQAFGGLHHVLILMLGLSLFLHIAGAMKHHVIDRDQTLRRMLPGTNEAPEPPAQSHSALPLLVALILWFGAVGAGGVLGAYSDHRGDAGPAEQTAEQTTEQTPEPAQTSDIASGWQIQDGSLGFEVTQMGNKVRGSFAEWDAVIDFEDPGAPGPAGTVEVNIPVASLALGAVTQQAMGPDYFDTANFPAARFSAQIEKTETGYVANGTLTIRDKTLPVSLPFDLRLDGDQAIMSGALTIQRLDFDIGRSLPDETSLAFAVGILVDLTASRNK